MKSILKSIIGISLTSGLLLTACSDWTDPEAFTVNETNIESQNPELYAKYLANLREYRNTDHQLVYAWFDNSEKRPFSRAHHLTDIPDSIDVVALMYPDNLIQSEMEEIENIRTQKGMKVIYSIDFDQIKASYNEIVDNAPEEEPIAVEFRQYLTEQTANLLSLAGKYNYDGICINYIGKSPILMTDTEKKEYMENENCFIGIVNDWLERNPEMSLSFQGQPENLYEGKFILDKCNVIFIASTEANSSGELTYLLSQSYLLEYATKYGATATVDNKKLSLQNFAQWAAAPQNGNELKAVGIYNLALDYYASGYNYQNVREAISILNPSVK